VILAMKGVMVVATVGHKGYAVALALIGVVSLGVVVMVMLAE
jgi:hypothetical protein